MELTPIGSILRALWFLVACLAIGAASYFIYRARGWKRKGVWAVIILGLFGFFPLKNWIKEREQVSYAREAWAHFKKLCDEKSGEKILQTFTDVRSVFVVRGLPPAREEDLYDQYWYGDPYSDATPWDKRAKSVATMLTLDSRDKNGTRKGLDFVEIEKSKTTPSKFERIRKPTTYRDKALVEEIEQPISRYGIAWEDISTPTDRKYWVAGSRLRLIDRQDNSLVAERIGYFIEAGFGSKAGQRRPWLASRGPDTTCPPLTGGDYSDSWFVTSVFKQEGRQ